MYCHKNPQVWVACGCGTYRIVSGQLTIGHNVETILKPARSHIPWPPNLVHGPFCGPKSTQIADIENPQNVAVVTVVRGQRHWNCWAVQLETSRVHRVELPSWQCNCQADLHPRYDYMRSLAHHSSSSAAIFFFKTASHPIRNESESSATFTITSSTVWLI